MVTPSKSLIQESLFDSVNEWLQTMCDSVSVAAGEAYAAGNFHAVGQLRTGLSFDVVQKDALEYAKTYRDNLVKKGEIQVSKIQYGPDGLPLLNKNGTIKRADETIQWLKGSEQKISNDIADIIQRGIMEGKATGVRQLASGGYPAGSIAEEINQYLSGYKSRASTIARTETARNYYHGEQSRYAKAGVKYVQYLGAPDACEECQPYINQVFELGTEPALPIHPNCRCDYRPLSPNDADYPDGVYEEDKLELPEGWDADLIEPEIITPPATVTVDNKLFGGMPDLSQADTIPKLEAEIEKSFGIKGFTIDKDLLDEGVSISTLQDELTAAGKLVSDYKCHNLFKSINKPQNMRNNVYMSCGPDEWDDNRAIVNFEGLMANRMELIKAYNNDVKDEFHPAGTSYWDVLPHELGHAIDWRILCMRTVKYIKYSVSPTNIKGSFECDVSARIDSWKRITNKKGEIKAEGHPYATKIVNRAVKGYNKSDDIVFISDMKSKEDLKRSISKYGAYYGDYETLAEAHADYYANGAEGCKVFSRLVVEETKIELENAEKQLKREIKAYYKNLIEHGSLTKETTLESFTEKVMRELGF